MHLPFVALMVLDIGKWGCTCSAEFSFCSLASFPRSQFTASCSLKPFPPPLYCKKSMMWVTRVGIHLLFVDLVSPRLTPDSSKRIGWQSGDAIALPNSRSVLWPFSCTVNLPPVVN
jgi:hypothetical protein